MTFSGEKGNTTVRSVWTLGRIAFQEVDPFFRGTQKTRTQPLPKASGVG